MPSDGDLSTQPAKITVYTTERFRRLVKMKAAEEGVTISDFMLQAVQKRLKEIESEKD